jgi:antitoxin CcdA
MSCISNRKARKPAANLSINSDPLKAARESGVNLFSETVKARENKVAASKRKAWLRDNADAIAAYNKFVLKHCVYSDGSRSV